MSFAAIVTRPQYGFSQLLHTTSSFISLSGMLRYRIVRSVYVIFDHIRCGSFRSKKSWSGSTLPLQNMLLDQTLPALLLWTIPYVSLPLLSDFWHSRHRETYSHGNRFEFWEPGISLMSSVHAAMTSDIVRISSIPPNSDSLHEKKNMQINDCIWFLIR